LGGVGCVVLEGWGVCVADSLCLVMRRGEKKTISRRECAPQFCRMLTLWIDTNLSPNNRKEVTKTSSAKGGKTIYRKDSRFFRYTVFHERGPLHLRKKQCLNAEFRRVDRKGGEGNEKKEHRMLGRKPGDGKRRWRAPLSRRGKVSSDREAKNKKTNQFSVAGGSLKTWGGKGLI